MKILMLQNSKVLKIETNKEVFSTRKPFRSTVVPYYYLSSDLIKLKIKKFDHEIKNFFFFKSNEEKLFLA